MAKTAKRKSPVKRKPAAKSSSSALALSGWIVAAGLAAAWGGPQLGLWSSGMVDRLPSFDRIRAPGSSDEALPPSVRDASAPSKPVSGKAEPQEAVEAAPRKPVLPSLKPDTITQILREADARPRIAVPKPQARAVSKDTSHGPVPPAPVPAPSPFVTAAIRKATTTPNANTRPGDLAIRRYPFTTAPAIAYVGDLRTLRILGGEGDWKKVEVSATGVTGWIRLQRLGSDLRTSVPRTETSAPSRSPVPAAALLREADAAGVR